MSELRHCPFCGSDARATVKKEYGVPSGDDGWLCQIECVECGARVKNWALVKSWAIESAVKKWNRRADNE